MKNQALTSLAPPPGGRLDPAACLAAFPALEKAKTTPQDPRHHAYTPFD